MLSRALGDTGLEVSAVSLGVGALGRPELDEGEVVRLLDRAVERGVRLIDAAPSYGLAEARLGRWLAAGGASRRDRVLVGSKGAYGAEGAEDWTPEAVRLGVEQALRRLQTDRLDLYLLHSCPLERLADGRLFDALDAERAAGRVRAFGYSGENEALAMAVGSGRLDAVMASVNLFDRGALAGPLRVAARAGLGVLAKRPLGNAPWRFATRPSGDYAEVYWDRLQALGGAEALAHGLPPAELALRFAAFAPGVSSAVLGTARVEHLDAALDAAERGPLPEPTRAALDARWAAVARGWRGEI